MISQDVWIFNGNCHETDTLHVRKLGWLRTDTTQNTFYFAEFWLAHFILEGHGMFEIGGQKYDAPAGTLLFFPPGRRAFYYRKTNDPWSYVWFELGGARPEAALAHLGIDFEHLHLVIPQREQFELKLREIAHRLKHGTSSPFATHAAAWEILDMIDAQLFTRETPEIPLVQNASQLIEDLLHPIPNVTELAERLGVDRTTLFRVFQDHHGTSPSEYIDLSRFERARELLLHTTMSMNEITRQCGLTSQQYFSAWFHRKSGQSPRDYRKKAGAKTKDR
jgi:AraC family transcriptional regulator of arabinose operon